MAFVHGNKAQTECWKIEVQMKNTEMPFRPHHPHFILHHLCGIHKISLETHHMYYVVHWIESIHNLPHLHKMCTKWETRTRITYRNRNSYTEGRAREWEREKGTSTRYLCVRRFDGLVKRECQAFYYYHRRHPYLLPIALIFSPPRPVPLTPCIPCVRCLLLLLFCSFTMFFEIMLHIRNSCKHKICMLPKHNKMHYVKWPKIDNSREKMDSWTCNTRGTTT